MAAVTARKGTRLRLLQYGEKYKEPQMDERSDSLPDVSVRATTGGIRRGSRAGKMDFDETRLMSKDWKVRLEKKGRVRRTIR